MNEYIPKKRVARLFGVDHRTVDPIACVANVRRLILPGQAVRYNREDIERVIAESTFIGARPAKELSQAK